MNTEYPKRDIEKPKTVGQKRKDLLVMLKNHVANLEGHAKDVQRVYGQTSPIMKWFVQASHMMRVAISELERTRR